MHTPIHLAMIYGSTRPGRFCDRIADWAAQRVQRQGGFVLDRVDPADVSPSAHTLRNQDASLAALKPRLERADAFLILTPEYNHGYPASLKSLIDSMYEPWRAKPVSFVSYGGASGGIRAVEQLRPVFAELHAATLRDTVAFAHAHNRFNADGELIDPARTNNAMSVLLTRLHWWASALRDARLATPYEAAA